MNKTLVQVLVPLIFFRGTKTQRICIKTEEIVNKIPFDSLINPYLLLLV